MGGCFGCCTKSTPVTVVDDLSKGVKIQGHTAKRTGISEEFWSTSTFDMDNSAFQSQGSVSSISISNQSLSQQSGTGSTSNSEFVNHGLLLWNQTRLQWTENNRSLNRSKKQEPVLSCNVTYDTLLGTNKPFLKPVPLPEMVDFLVDAWEQEGLYD